VPIVLEYELGVAHAVVLLPFCRAPHAVHAEVAAEVQTVHVGVCVVHCVVLLSVDHSHKRVPHPVVGLVANLAFLGQGLEDAEYALLQSELDVLHCLEPRLGFYLGFKRIIGEVVFAVELNEEVQQVALFDPLRHLGREQLALLDSLVGDHALQGQHLRPASEFVEQCNRNLHFVDQNHVQHQENVDFLHHLFHGFLAEYVFAVQ